SRKLGWGRINIVGPENQSPLDELQVLDRQIDQVQELAGLKPIFFRLDELAKEHPGDFEIQLAVTEVKQRVVLRGTAIKQAGQTMQSTAQVRVLPPSPIAPAGPIPTAAVPAGPPPAYKTPPTSYA